MRKNFIVLFFSVLCISLAVNAFALTVGEVMGKRGIDEALDGANRSYNAMTLRINGVDYIVDAHSLTYCKEAECGISTSKEGTYSFIYGYGMEVPYATGTFVRDKIIGIGTLKVVDGTVTETGECIKIAEFTFTAAGKEKIEAGEDVLSVITQALSSQGCYALPEAVMFTLSKSKSGYYTPNPFLRVFCTAGGID